MHKPAEDKPMILVVSHVIPYPPAAGNEIRILKMLMKMQEFGFDIILLLNQESVPSEVMDKLKLLFGRVHLISDDYKDGTPMPVSPHRRYYVNYCRFLEKANLTWLSSLMDCEKKKKARDLKRWFASDPLIQATWHLFVKYRPAAVMAEYIFTSPCLKVIPEGVLKIIDTHDMFSRKKKQVIYFGIEDLLSCTWREERRYLLNADLIIAIQSHEAKLFRKMSSRLEIITVGIDFDIEPIKSDKMVVPGRILIVGSDNPLNRHGLSEFYSRAWPSIRSKVSGATLCVVGKLANYLETDDERVLLNGWVEDLKEEYQKAAVIVNPTVAGTGLKIKSVEAICYSKALVSTLNGVEGIEYTGMEAPFIVAPKWSDFTDSVVSILCSDEKRIHMENLARNYASENFGKDKIYLPLKEKLDSMRGIGDSKIIIPDKRTRNQE